MAKNYLLNGLDFFSNQAGVMIFYLGTLTNDGQASDFYSSPTTHQSNVYNATPSFIETKSFEPLSIENVNLITDKSGYVEEQIILDFANKLIGSSRDIEPEINAIVQANFWELL